MYDCKDIVLWIIRVIGNILKIIEHRSRCRFSIRSCGDVEFGKVFYFIVNIINIIIIIIIRD
jgi:hypothetical protein